MRYRKVRIKVSQERLIKRLETAASIAGDRSMDAMEFIGMMEAAARRADTQTSFLDEANALKNKIMQLADTISLFARNGRLAASSGNASRIQELVSMAAQALKRLYGLYAELGSAKNASMAYSLRKEMISEVNHLKKLRDDQQKLLKILAAKAKVGDKRAVSSLLDRMKTMHKRARIAWKRVSLQLNTIRNRTQESAAEFNRARQRAQGNVSARFLALSKKALADAQSDFSLAEKIFHEVETSLRRSEEIAFKM